MRILEILEACEGGTRTHVDHILTGLALEHTMGLVFSLNRDPEYQQQIDHYSQLGVDCFELPMIRKPAPISDRSVLKKLNAIVSEWRPDIIHAHSSKAGYLLRRLNTTSYCKRVYTPHCLYYPSQNGLKRLIFKWGEQYRSASIDRFIAVSNAEQNNLMHHIAPIERISRINNGVVIPPEYTKEQGIRILFPARAVRQKGWPYFFKTAQAILEALPEAILVFAGEGPLLEDMRSQVERANLVENIILPGLIADMEAEYKKADVVMITSAWEGQPYALLEAMAFGCPVAGFSIAGIDELIEPGYNGILAEPFNCIELAEKVVALLQQPEEMIRLGANGREKIELSYQKKDFLRQIAAFYKSL